MRFSCDNQLQNQICIISIFKAKAQTTIFKCETTFRIIITDFKGCEKNLCLICCIYLAKKGFSNVLIFLSHLCSLPAENGEDDNPIERKKFPV